MKSIKSVVISAAMAAFSCCVVLPDALAQHAVSDAPPDSQTGSLYFFFVYLFQFSGLFMFMLMHWGRKTVANGVKDEYKAKYGRYAKYIAMLSDKAVKEEYLVKRNKISWLVRLMAFIAVVSLAGVVLTM